VTRVAVIDSNQLTRDDLKSLLQERHAHCVSLYLRLAQIGQETPADDIRLKNLVREAEEGLVARGLRRPEAQRILEPASQLIGDSLSWQTDGAGLAIFLSEDGARRFRLPHAFEDLVIVNDRYHIEQLLPLLHGDSRFYVLALQRHEVRLYEATPHTITRIAIPEMPKTIDDVLQFDEYPDTQRWYSNAGTAVGGQRQNAMFYGQGATKDFIKKETESFFRAIDAALIQALKLEKAPLVLACLPEEVPEYRNINTYQHLMDEAIATGPQLLNDDELYRRAWEIVRPVIEKTQRDAVARYDEYAGTDRASNQLTEIVPAAVFGRVESLTVAAGRHLWGSFDPATGEVQPHDERQAGDEDLIDVAASYALVTRGDVFQVPPELMPQEASAVAVFRY
jgi:hypothetical protein